MALTEIEFELSPQQFEMMGYPHLRQGQPLDVQLQSSELLPEPGADAWYAVRPQPLSPRLIALGSGLYAFAGQIEQADIVKSEELETAALVVQCGVAPVRLMCAPRADGTLPYGTWETRYVTATGRLYGVVEEDFAVGVGERIGVTIWSFQRLILTPDDPAFGQWHESVELLPTPYLYDRVLVTARIHRPRM
jgi:hypothetical protein